MPRMPEMGVAGRGNWVRCCNSVLAWGPGSRTWGPGGGNWVRWCNSVLAVAESVELVEGGVEALEDFREDGVVEGRRSRVTGAEAAAAGVLGDAGLAFGGAGSGWVLGVGAVGLSLGSRRQWEPLSFSIVTHGWEAAGGWEGISDLLTGG